MSTRAAGAPATAPPPQAVSFGELLGRAAALYRARPLAYLAIAAVSVLPAGAASALAAAAADGLGDAAQAAVLASAWLVSTVLLLPVSGTAVAVAVVGTLGGRPVGVAGALAPLRRRAAPLAGALVLALLGVTSGLLALVVPGVVLLVLWLFAGPAAVIEQRDVVGSLRRSQDLVRGAWWTVFLAWLVIQVVAAAAAFALRLPGDALGAALGGAGGGAVAAAGGVAAALLVQPFAMIAVALLYVDRTVRREGRLPGPAAPGTLSA